MAVEEGYFGRRWRGDVAMPILFWRDMLGVGTAINLVASFMGLLLASQGVELGVAAVVYLAPLPYNAFLFLAVWRSPQRTRPTAIASAVWLAAMIVV